MKRKKKRFVVYADFLGTKQRYSQPGLVVRGRELLEQALARWVIPELNTEDMNLYVYSDTAIVTCPRLKPLLKPISNLCGHFLELQETRFDDKTSLWLRGAISHGTELYVDHLTNYERVRTIPFLDTSLPSAYELESVRKGSRMFGDPAIPDEAFGDCQDLFFKWQQITGHGIYVPNVREYLWPTLAYATEEHLKRATFKLHTWWSQELSKREWLRDEYYKSLIHLDETLKLFIRTVTVRCTEVGRMEFLLGLLPKCVGPNRNIRYEWGMWFQILRGLVESGDPSLSSIQDIERAYATVMANLEKGGHLQHFMTELGFPDYAGFRCGLERLGLKGVE